MTNRQLLELIMKENENILNNLKAFQRKTDSEKIEELIENKKLENDKKISRIKRRKKQVQKEPLKVVELIKTKRWKFSNPIRDKEQHGYVWRAVDKDGIQIIGKEHEDGTPIYFDFGIGKPIEFKSEYRWALKRTMISYQMDSEIDEWIKERDERKSCSYNKYKDRVKYEKCIYCSSKLSMGTVCESCRNKYSKTRRGIGGYPTYDSFSATGKIMKKQ